MAKKTFERIVVDGTYYGIIHECEGVWYLTLLKKKLSFPNFRTCASGIVREPGKSLEVKSWNTKEEALAFFEEIRNAIS